MTATAAPPVWAAFGADAVAAADAARRVPAPPAPGARPVGPTPSADAARRVPGRPPGGRPLAIGGLAKLSTCDWPGKLAATVFLQGCPWNCLYCHNPDLIDSRAPGRIAWADVLAFLRGRVGLLDAVVFSGGEATRQDLAPALGQVRDLGFLAGLHTSGAYPKRLAELLPLVDWVGFDVKALPENMAQVAGAPGAGPAMTASLKLLIESGVPHQIRTTWGAGVPTVSTAAQAESVLEWARAQGAPNPVLQPVRPDGTRPQFRAPRTP
ncbi:MAG: anaerobic ribonucleoside-triphosphate reductase activating protein [Bifidobacteriaceae bacterium]|nr:anaerobic ribonucleoside-triphosphate reductase activating protein [Bifidobacteriaceae bacterium]